MNVKPKQLLKRCIGCIDNNKSTILMGVAMATSVGALVGAIMVTKEASEKLEDKKQELEDEDITAVKQVTEYGKVVLPYYGPIVLAEVVSLGCMIYAHKLDLKKQAALLGAAQLYLNENKEYRNKVIERIGKKDEEKIREEILQDRVDSKPVNDMMVAGDGKTLCYDPLSNQYFMSSIEDILNAASLQNIKLYGNSEMYVSANEWLWDIGAQKNDVWGDDLGWNVNTGFELGPGKSRIAPDGRPCYCINYTIMPEPNFKDVY